MSNSVLYVEDEEDYQILVRRILGKAGFSVKVASSGSEGLAVLQRGQPRLLILDVNLPDADGYALCSQLRNDAATSALPILFLTVKRRPEEWLKGFSAGGNDYLPKPLNPPELVERVMGCLSHRSVPPVLPHEEERVHPEHRLIQAVIAGNRAAFEVLIQKYQYRLQDSLRAAGRNSVDAEDITSEAFALAFQRLDQFRSRASFYTWLYRIALNLSYRPRWRSGVYVHDLKRVDKAPRRVWGGPDEEGFGGSRHARLAQALEAFACLPRHYRQLLRWHFRGKVSYQTMARWLKVPVGTVMSRLFSAKQLLRQSWKKLHRRPSPLARFVVKRPVG